MPSLHHPMTLPVSFAAPPLRRVLGRISRALALALARRRERAYLAEMEPRMLRDIGLSAGQVRAECRKLWWEV